MIWEKGWREICQVFFLKVGWPNFTIISVSSGLFLAVTACRTPMRETSSGQSAYFEFVPGATGAYIVNVLYLDPPRCDHPYDYMGCAGWSLWAASGERRLVILFEHHWQELGDNWIPIKCPRVSKSLLLESLSKGWLSCSVEPDLLFFLEFEFQRWDSSLFYSTRQLMDIRSIGFQIDAHVELILYVLIVEVVLCPSSGIGYTGYCTCSVPFSNISTDEGQNSPVFTTNTQLECMDILEYPYVQVTASLLLTICLCTPPQ